MTEAEYWELQKRLTKKIENNPYRRFGGYKREESYKEGILSAKSILSDYYHRGANREREIL